MGCISSLERVGNFQHKSENEILGLEEEELDEVVRRVVKEVEGN
jgi:hypothetical protein